VRPQGESGLRVSFSTDDRKVVSGPDGYFEETGYMVTATVSPELVVLVDVQQRH
jgi:hypothetical protein